MVLIDDIDMMFGDLLLSQAFITFSALTVDLNFSLGTMAYLNVNYNTENK